MAKQATTRATSSASRKKRADVILISRRHEPTHDEIAMRAYELFTRRGGAAGSDISDWLQAESELRAAQG